MKRLGIVLAAVLLSAAATATAQDDVAASGDKYVLLSETRTGEMERKLNRAGARGYRFTGTQGRDGNVAAVVMTLDPDGRQYRYILLATLRVGTMQRELNEVPHDYRYVGMMEFDSMGRELAVILEADLVDVAD